MEWLLAIALKPVVLFVLFVPGRHRPRAGAAENARRRCKRLLLREVSEEARRKPLGSLLTLLVLDKNKPHCHRQAINAP